MAALRAAVFPLFAKNRRGGHFLPPPPPVRVLKKNIRTTVSHQYEENPLFNQQQRPMFLNDVEK